jgi:hypothetical protein
MRRQETTPAINASNATHPFAVHLIQRSARAFTGRWKKSAASMVAAWVCRNFRQVVSVSRMGAGVISQHPVIELRQCRAAARGDA